MYMQNFRGAYRVLFGELVVAVVGLLVRGRRAGLELVHQVQKTVQVPVLSRHFEGSLDVDVENVRTLV